MANEENSMIHTISSVRLTIPKGIQGEIIRNDLLEQITSHGKKVTYVQAGAGYGKTILLSQIARATPYSVWYSLDGENDILLFINALCDAVTQVFPEFTFVTSAYLPFMDNQKFSSILANAFMSNIEHLSKPILFIFDDLHTIRDTSIKEVIANLIPISPDSIRFCFGSREILIQQFIPFQIRGQVSEFKQINMTFTPQQTADILGFEDKKIFKITEGWPLAIGCFRVLLENGVSPVDVPSQGKEALYSYLIYECINQIPPEMVHFLTASAYFDELDPIMLNSVLGIKNAKLMLESLVARNLFTIKTSGGYYRYHALFRKCLIETNSDQNPAILLKKAAYYYHKNNNFGKAAEYAMYLKDKELLQEIILTNYKLLINTGKYNELRQWFQTLGEDYPETKPELYLAKGTYFSYIGNFTEAQINLNKAIPAFSNSSSSFYVEAMVHKARVLRNTVSFEESTELLHTILQNSNQISAENTYTIVIEILYNFCWNSQMKDAYTLVNQMIEKSARAGNLKVKLWYERYLSAIHFFAGNMKACIYYYEKSLQLPIAEQNYLDIHDIAIYAAKAYQMIGDRTRSLSLLDESLQKISIRSNYEELWSNYLFAAEIHFQNAVIDHANGLNVSYETTKAYFNLANEYAPLYRKTELQTQWVKMQRLTYSLMFTGKSKEGILKEIYDNFDNCSAYLKCIVMSRLMGYFGANKDYSNAAKCASTCIEIGEQADMLLHPIVAYGILARASIAGNSALDSDFFVQRYMMHCDTNGVYAYFKARKDYDPVIQYAIDHAIEPDITDKIIAFSGYKKKKAYVKTFGGLTIFCYGEMDTSVKMRTKKERELFAFLLDAGQQGASKNQIYNAIWSESESDNVKRLIGVNLTQIKKDLESIGIKNAVQCSEKRYHICRDEFICDFELFEKLTAEMSPDMPFEKAEKILSLYTGEYLSDFEAHWAIAKRLKYQSIYNQIAASIVIN